MAWSNYWRRGVWNDGLQGLILDIYSRKEQAMAIWAFGWEGTEEAATAQMSG